VRLDDDHMSAQLSRASNPRLSAAAQNAPDSTVPMPEKGEINGGLLQQMRESRGLDLRTMADVTKVGINYLRALEANQVNELPSRVYLRGFLVQYARALRVNPDRLVAGYMASLEHYGPSRK
jgi:hypothetical protein